MSAKKQPVIEDLGPVPIEMIRPSEQNIRTKIHQAELLELAESIKTAGIIQPIIVRAIPTARSNTEPWYEIVTGERRWRAAKIAGLTDIPARLLEDGDEQHVLQLTLIENLQRSNLDPIDEANGYQKLIDSGLTQAQVAKTVGKAQPTIANRIRMLALPHSVRMKVRDETLSPAHAIALARFKHLPAIAEKLAEIAIEAGWTSKQLETGLPASHALVTAGLAADVREPAVPFYTTCEQNCPYQAYVSGWCLKPDHREQLMHTAQKPAPASSTPRSYARIWTEIPSCTEACTCRATISIAGHSTQVCTNPDLRQKLEGEHGKTIQKLEAQKRAECKAAITQHLEQLTEIASTELTLITATLLLNQGKEADPTSITSDNPLDIIKKTIATITDDALHQWASGMKSQRAQLIDWYLEATALRDPTPRE